jgi:hypothetical protein
MKTLARSPTLFDRKIFQINIPNYKAVVFLITLQYTITIFIKDIKVIGFGNKFFPNFKLGSKRQQWRSEYYSCTGHSLSFRILNCCEYESQCRLTEGTSHKRDVKSFYLRSLFIFNLSNFLNEVLVSKDLFLWRPCGRIPRGSQFTAKL